MPGWAPVGYSGPASTPWPDNPPTIALNDPVEFTPNDTTGDLIDTETATPPVGLSGGGSTSCTCPPVDFSPLTALDYGSKFPFGIFAWVHDTLTGSTDAAPTWDIPYPGDVADPIHVDLTSTLWEDTLRTPFFLVLEFMMTLGAVIYVATTMLGWDRGEDDSDD
jgi:hypothetical protein